MIRLLFLLLSFILLTLSSYPPESMFPIKHLITMRACKAIEVIRFGNKQVGNNKNGMSMERIIVNVFWCDKNFGAELGENVPGAIVITAKTYDN